MLGIIRNAGHVVYRVWFYILVTVPILLFFPILLIFTISEKTYPHFFGWHGIYGPDLFCTVWAVFPRLFASSAW